MAQLTASTDGPRFRISGVLAKSAALFFRRPFTYAFWTWGTAFAGMFLLGLVNMALDPIPTLNDASRLLGSDRAARIALALLPLVILAAIGTVSCAAVLQIAWRDIRQFPVRATADALAGLSRFFPLFFLSLLAGFSILAGFVLYLIPALFLISMWAVAGPACVVERLGPVRSLGRSRRLTKGYRWRTLGLVLTIGVINLGVVFLGAAVEQVFHLKGELRAVSILIWALMQLTVIPFYGICFVVAYHDMRIAKEGADIESLTAVFD